MIPKIIHQVWEGRTEPIPDFYLQLGETWKKHHPDWKYQLWNGDLMDAFVNEHYPQLSNAYFSFKYSVQRWDVIRYLILDKIGGIYADLDYECIHPADNYVSEKDKCYFAMEPEDHCIHFFKQNTFNNAFMASCPEHLFFKKIIDHIFFESQYAYTGNKVRDVHATTGPVMLTELYNNFPNKDDIVLFPEELVSPWTKLEARSVINGNADIPYLEKKLEKAFAIHYFFSLW